jgi:ribosomal protein S6--L-glutamate ligase
MDQDDGKIIVGSEEWCSLPHLDVPAIKCRVDSGARTSSLHAFNIRSFKRGGQPWVSFEVHPLQKDRKVTVFCEAEVVDHRLVKSSSGVAERRWVISTRLHIGSHEWDIEVTLTNRDTMGYRMLLGREAMRDRMLVDPSSSFCVEQLADDAARANYDVVDRHAGGLKIGVLATDPELYSNQRLIEAGEEHGHEMHFLNIASCYMKLDATNPEVHTRGGRLLDDLDAVIPRIRPSITFYGCALTRQFESMGVYSLNSASAIGQSRDKLHALQRLLGNNLDIPVTGFAKSVYDTGDLVAMVGAMVGGSPLVLKLLEGTQGRGVVLAETRKAAESVINAFKAVRANILVQEFIKEAGGSDLRCFVVRNRVVAAIERQAAPGEFRANLHQGGSAKKVKITREERRIAVRAAKALGLTVAGVDMLRSDRGPLVLEVNSSPGLEGVETATGKDVAGMMIQAIERKLDWKAPA